MKHGIYFRTATSEVLDVHDGHGQPPGGDWKHVTEEAGLGLVAVRRLLVEHGLVDGEGAKEVYWYLPPKKQDDEQSPPTQSAVA